MTSKLIIALAAITLFAAAAAAQTIVVTPNNTQGWSTADTRPGGDVDFVVDASAPGDGALQLTTDNTNAAKAQYLHGANTLLSAVTSLSYMTKQNSGPATADPSYQLPVCLGGFDSSSNCVAFTNFVYEPYWNGTVIPNTWQTWDVDSGQFWSSATVSAGGACSFQAGAGGPPFYTLSQIKTACPNAVVVGFGVNVGTYNPNYDVEADYVEFNGTTYDFEPYFVVTSPDQCKNGGWRDARRSTLTAFKNQGDCIQYVNTGK